jgi:ribonuclease Z
VEAIDPFRECRQTEGSRDCARTGMRPFFHATLINDPFGDPGVFVDCLFERRALLFDLGDLRTLATRKLLRVTDVFVTHTHMDHFMGFDWLLRLTLGREQRVRLFGPPGFVAQVEHRLAAYTWNLVHNYETDFTLEVTEVHPDAPARRASFRCRSAFRREAEETAAWREGVLLDEEAFRVRGVFLDHSTPCLAFALEEKQHLNVWKNRLDEMGLPTGPWLAELKRAIRQGAADTTPIRVRWREAGAVKERIVALGELRARAVRVTPGQKIVYVTDAVYSEANAVRIVELARGADVLFIEAPFLEEDAARAASRYHLTAHQAGTLARRAAVKSVVPFHFSPRYHDRGEALRAEVMRAFTA